MLNKALGQVLITASNFIGLEAAKVENKTAKIALYTAENLTKFLAFSDLGMIGTSKSTPGFSKSVIGALGLTTAITLDDILINLGLYKNHHFAKLSSALYAGYRLADNTQISGLIIDNHNQVTKTNQVVKTGIISGVLLCSSYLFGSSDMINIMRSNTNDCIEFANEISDLSDGAVNIYKDMRIAIGASGLIGGGRQFLCEYKLDIGGPLNGAISTGINTTVNVASSAHSEKDFKNSLVKKFQSKLQNLSDEQITQLDHRSQKILEALPDYIEKASSSIAKNAANSATKTAYQQILAASKYELKNNGQSTYDLDMGLSVFVTSNLFNTTSADNLEAKVQKNLKNIETSYNFNYETYLGKTGSINKKLNTLKHKKSESTYDTVFGASKKIFNVIAPIAIDSILVGMMHKEDATWHTPSGYSNCYMPVSSMVGVGETFIDIEAFTAIKELQYLSNELDGQIAHSTIYV